MRSWRRARRALLRLSTYWRTSVAPRRRLCQRGLSVLRARARSDRLADGAPPVGTTGRRPRIIWLQRSRYQRVPHRPWRQKHQCPVRCRAIIYWATAAIYGEALDSHFRPYLLSGRTSETKNDCNKKSPPLDKTTSKQPVLTSRDAARPDVRLRTRFGTPASPSIEHRSTAAAAPRLGRSSKLTPLACSECIAAAADGRSSRRVVRRTSCPRCRRAAAQLWAYRGLRLACCGCATSHRRR